jgi:hypothetical protein
MKCAGSSVTGESCNANLPTFPSLWLAAGREFCSEKCAERADNKVHTATRNEPADRWMADHDARQEALREANRRAS